jgi:F-type H+-transporting ATPase subunit a
MHESAPFTWLSLFGVEEARAHVVMAIIVGALLIFTSVVATQQLKRAMIQEGGLVPDEKLTFKNFFEIIAEQLFKLTEGVIGHHDAPLYFPLIGSLFVFIFASNLVGLIPGVVPPTENLNTTAALGLFVFVYYNFVGFKAHGAGYLKHFLGPIWWLAPLMLVIEVSSHLFRPLSLSLRLRFNIMGDHVVLHLFSSLVPYILPVIFFGMGVFVAFIQAFVFCLLTMVYISLSTAHDH